MNIFRKKQNLVSGFPISIDLIDENLYLGGLSAATDVNTLNKYKITHILTVNDYPLPRTIAEMKKISTKFIQLSDQPNSDLLSHFDETDAFISDGVSKGAVLVHCFVGVSRSATIVIAYIMKKYNLSYEEAYEKVQHKRPVYPNDGFVSQLKLYEEMAYNMDPTNKKCKLYRLQKAAQQVRKLKIVPEAYLDLISPDPEASKEAKVFSCKKCDKILATESNLFTHKCHGEICTKSYFVEPMAWMNVTHCMKNNLYCPQCNVEVGRFNWVAGCYCPCEVKVYPGFCLSPSEVNFTKCHI